jgi:hypothetical protein
MIDATVAPKVGFISPFGTTACNVNHINAVAQPRPEAEARDERRLFAVACMPMLGWLRGYATGQPEVTARKHRQAHLLETIPRLACRDGRSLQLGEGWHSSRHTVRFWNPLVLFQKETDARCYASATAYAMMIPACNACFAQLQRPTHSPSWSWRPGPWRVSSPDTWSKRCWPNVPVVRRCGPAARSVGPACAVKAL